MTNALAHTRNRFVSALRDVGAIRPTAPAMLLGRGTVTHAQLWEAADAVAPLLPGGERVGLFLPHGPDMAVGILATLVAGSSYVPLDPAWPAARLAAMAARAGVAVVVGPDDAVTLAPGAAHVRWPDLAFDGPSASPAAPPVDASPPVGGGRSDDEAYVLFTSGSTGGPKGVAQTLRAIETCSRNQIASLGLTAEDRLTLLTSFGYDMAVVDFFSALLAGASVVPWDVATRGLHGLPEHLAATGATVYHSSPTVLRHLLALRPTAIPSLRLVLTGGEPVSGGDVAAARTWLGRDIEVVNGYGATEASFVTHHHVLPAQTPEAGNLPCGRPLPGYDVVVVDPDEAGVGELELRGPDVARGWLGADHGAQRGAFGEAAGVPFHRPGDLGRLDADGVLHHHGRRDRRVKINGVRLELAEVELALMSLPGVAHAAVRAVGETPQALEAWVEPTPGCDLAADVVRAGAAALLPPAGVPGRVHLGPIPRTPSGKLDRTALAAPSEVRLESAADAPDAPDTASPVDPVQRQVLDAYAAALGRRDVPLDRGLFELGGSSLTAAAIHARLAATPLGAELALTDVLAHPSAQALAAHLSGEGEPTGSGTGDPGQEPGEVALARARARAERRARSTAGRLG